MAKIQLLGRLLISGVIEAVTGLHIGSSPTGLVIGGMDNPVIRDPHTRNPYIPGSSLKGKLRSLAERARGFDPEDANQTQQIGQVRIHICKRPEDYATCQVCQVFGLPGEMPHSKPTRLTVRDTLLDPDSLKGAQLDNHLTEVKWEVSIDRITSAALPRQIERVPAGARFKEAELVLSFYDLGHTLAGEFQLIRQLLLAMQLLEDDYLGGLGSRGSGKVCFRDLSLVARKGSTSATFRQAPLDRLKDLLPLTDELIVWTQERLAEA